MTMSLGTRIYSVFEGVKIAFDSIRTNKVRAGLTILGIAVGVFVVTVMSAAVHGINQGVSSSIAAAGPTTFFISKWPAEITNCNGGAESCPWLRNKPLTLAQATPYSGMFRCNAGCAELGIHPVPVLCNIIGYAPELG